MAFTCDICLKKVEVADTIAHSEAHDREEYIWMSPERALEAVRATGIQMPGTMFWRLIDLGIVETRPPAATFRTELVLMPWPFTFEIVERLARLADAVEGLEKDGDDDSFWNEDGALLKPKHTYRNGMIATSKGRKR